MKKVYCYARVSTIGQSLDGDSLETQEKKMIEYCKFKNLEIVSIHKEQGVSGAIPPRERPQLNLILANLEAGNASGLVVCKIDRLSRSTCDFMNLMSEFKDKWDFYSITPDMDSSTTHGKFTMNLLSIVAELERDMIKDRVKEVMGMKKQKKELVGSVPFGKKLIPNTNILEDDPDEQETIKEVKRLRSMSRIVKKKTGDVTRPVTLTQICNELVKQKRKNKSGESIWHPAQIRRILNDGSYKSGRKAKK